MYQLYFISKLKLVIFYRRRYYYSNRKKYIYRRSCTWNWRDKQRCAVKWPLWENILFFKFVFSKCNFTCVFICFFIRQSTFLSYYFSALNVFQGFSFSFAENFRTRSWQVVEWFKGYFTRAVYFWKAKLELVSRQHNFPTKPKVKFLTFSRHGQNWTVLYFFRKSELLTMKNRELKTI